MKDKEFLKEFKRTNGRERLLSLNLSSEEVAVELVRVYKSVLGK
jgi:hypothetical protein